MTGESNSKVDYDVGYGKPPKHTQFKKGRSGNPRGVPQPKSRGQIAAEILGRQLTMTVNGKRRRVRTDEALMTAQAQKGMRGDIKATKLLFEIGDRAAPAQAVQSQEEVEQDFNEAIEGLSLDELRFISDFNRRYNEILNRRRK